MKLQLPKRNEEWLHYGRLYTIIENLNKSIYCKYWRREGFRDHWRFCYVGTKSVFNMIMEVNAVGFKRKL